MRHKEMEHSFFVGQDRSLQLAGRPELEIERGSKAGGMTVRNGRGSKVTVYGSVTVIAIYRTAFRIETKKNETGSILSDGSQITAISSGTNLWSTPQRRV